MHILFTGLLVAGIILILVALLIRWINTSHAETARAEEQMFRLEAAQTKDPEEAAYLRWYEAEARAVAEQGFLPAWIWISMLAAGILFTLPMLISLFS